MLSILPYRIMFASMALPFLLGACTSVPLLSRNGGMAAAEIVTQGVLGLGGATTNPVDQNIEASGAAYLGGVIPVRWERHEDARPIETGTRLFVDGRSCGSVPLATNLAKPGPHTIRLEIPGWQPYSLKLANPVRLPVGKGQIESWPPVFVNRKTGGIFTAPKLTSLDPYWAGAGGNPNNTFRVGSEPMLIVTTTDKPRRGWSKIGEMKPLAPQG